MVRSLSLSLRYIYASRWRQANLFCVCDWVSESLNRFVKSIEPFMTVMMLLSVPFRISLRFKILMDSFSQRRIGSIDPTNKMLTRIPFGFDTDNYWNELNWFMNKTSVSTGHLAHLCIHLLIHINLMTVLLVKKGKRQSLETYDECIFSMLINNSQWFFKTFINNVTLHSSQTLIS